MSKALKISKSGYYRWRHTNDDQEQTQNQLTAQIRRVFAESRRTYGSPRIYRQLKTEGIACGRHRIARYMRNDGIVARRHRKYRKPVSKQRIQPVAANLLNREFNVTSPNSAWVCDVSYFWTRNGWLYLAIVMDLFSRKIVGWSMSNRIDKELTKDALQMAIDARQPDDSLVHHSDQGLEYRNNAYLANLQAYGITVSMSRKANCYDNAVAESFFKTIKTELSRQIRFKSQDDARSAIFEYIEVFYNRNRMHSTLGYVSPVEYERLNSIN